MLFHNPKKQSIGITFLGNYGTEYIHLKSVKTRMEYGTIKSAEIMGSNNRFMIHFYTSNHRLILGKSITENEPVNFDTYEEAVKILVAFGLIKSGP